MFMLVPIPRQQRFAAVSSAGACCQAYVRAQRLGLREGWGGRRESCPVPAPGKLVAAIFEAVGLVRLRSLFRHVAGASWVYTHSVQNIYPPRARLHCTLSISGRHTPLVVVGRGVTCAKCSIFSGDKIESTTRQVRPTSPDLG